MSELVLLLAVRRLLRRTSFSWRAGAGLRCHPTPGETRSCLSPQPSSIPLSLSAEIIPHPHPPPLVYLTPPAPGASCPPSLLPMAPRRSPSSQSSGHGRASFAPPSDIASFKDLLLFEERLKQNAALLRSRKRKYEGALGTRPFAGSSGGFSSHPGFSLALGNAALTAPCHLVLLGSLPHDPPHRHHLSHPQGLSPAIPRALSLLLPLLVSLGPP